MKEQYLNQNAFTLNGFVLGTNGNASLGNCYGPGVNNWDIAVHKDFKLTERVNMQFRFEFFNAFNKTQFQGVNGGINPTQLCFADKNGTPVAVTTTNATFQATGDTCFLNGNPFSQTIPNNAYQVVATGPAPPGSPAGTPPSPTSQTLTSNTFGQATFTRGARQIQYALRFTF